MCWKLFNVQINSARVIKNYDFIVLLILVGVVKWPIFRDTIPIRGKIEPGILNMRPLKLNHFHFQ